MSDITKDLDQVLRLSAPKPDPAVTGVMLPVQKEAYAWGWKEGIATYRKLLRRAATQKKMQ